MPEKVSIQQLEQYLWGSANFLRNKVDAGDYKAYIFPLMFYKRICDVYDEEYQKALDESDEDQEYAKSDINHQFQIPDGCHWNELRNTSHNVGQKIQNSFREIEKANPKQLFGIFGNVNWGNKEKLSDGTLRDLVEHFSRLKLSTKNISDDIMGNSYEYLIKKFADDSGHTAAEFYTNRTVVSLMIELLEPQSNESVYDPTCGTGGMLLECINYLKKNNKDYRTLTMFGQEKNKITSGIAKMNMFFHGCEEARIKKGDTLTSPLFLVNDKLQKFDVILANPPYSIKKWNRTAWQKDPFGRNIYGTPPQGKADFAFLEHIVISMNDKGRASILFPHGVLFRDGESKLREGLVNDDKLEAVIGLGPDLFYNASMESCIVLLNAKKKASRKNKVLFINALDQIKRHKNKNLLTSEHIKYISQIFKKFKSVTGRSYVANFEEIKQNQFLLNISVYVKNHDNKKSYFLKDVINDWKESSNAINHSLSNLLNELEVKIK